MVEFGPVFFLEVSDYLLNLSSIMGFPGDSNHKESACSEGDPGSIPGLEDPLEKGMAV